MFLFKTGLGLSLVISICIWKRVRFVLVKEWICILCMNDHYAKLQNCKFWDSKMICQFLSILSLLNVIEQSIFRWFFSKKKTLLVSNIADKIRIILIRFKAISREGWCLNWSKTIRNIKKVTSLLSTFKIDMHFKSFFYRKMLKMRENNIKVLFFVGL